MNFVGEWTPIDNNSRLSRSDFPDFNDPNRLGEGQAMVDRLTNLINIFNGPLLDFSRNRADVKNYNLTK
jgi:type I restriction enzyme M protein